jgi:uncharacterized ParB-like nuclease family protein
MELPVSAIRRPLAGVRSNDQKKVEDLKASIKEIGLQVPIDVLEVDGVYYGEGREERERGKGRKEKEGAGLILSRGYARILVHPLSLFPSYFVLFFY